MSMYYVMNVVNRFFKSPSESHKVLPFLDTNVSAIKMRQSRIIRIHTVNGRIFKDIQKKKKCLFKSNTAIVSGSMTNYN